MTPGTPPTRPGPDYLRRPDAGSTEAARRAPGVSPVATPEQLLARLRAIHHDGDAIANSIQLVRDGSLGWFLDNVPPRLMERAAAFVARHPEVAPGRGAWMAAAAREARMRADLVPHPGSRVTGR